MHQTGPGWTMAGPGLAWHKVSEFYEIVLKKKENLALSKIVGDWDF